MDLENRGVNEFQVRHQKEMNKMRGKCTFCVTGRGIGEVDDTHATSVDTTGTGTVVTEWAVAGSTTGAEVAGITVVAISASPAGGTGGADASPSHAGVAQSMLASACLVAAGTVLG